MKYRSNRISVIIRSIDKKVPSSMIEPSYIFISHIYRCSHDARNKLGARLTTVKSKGPIKGLLKKMGNKLSCSCGPLKIKGYRFDPGSEPWDAQADIIRRGKGAGPMLK